MISPSYIKDYSFFDKNIIHIVVRRDWKDQYVEIAGFLKKLVGKNISLGLNPMNEELKNRFNN